MPSNEEIRRIRRLIDQISHGLDELEPEQRQQLQQAAAPESTAPSTTATATYSNASTPPKPSHPTNQTKDPPSRAPHFKPTSSPPSNAAPAWPPAPGNSRHDYPNCSANKPGAQPDSAHPPTSTSFNNASYRSNSKSSTSAYNSKNETRTSPPPAPRTANRELMTGLNSSRPTG